MGDEGFEPFFNVQGENEFLRSCGAESGAVGGDLLLKRLLELWAMLGCNEREKILFQIERLLAIHAKPH